MTKFGLKMIWKIFQITFFGQSAQIGKYLGYVWKKLLDVRSLEYNTKQPQPMQSLAPQIRENFSKPLDKSFSSLVYL